MSSIKRKKFFLKILILFCGGVLLGYRELVAFGLSSSEETSQGMSVRSKSLAQNKKLEKNTFLSYDFKPLQKWNKPEDMQAILTDYDHLVLEGDSSIDLNLNFINEDLQTEFQNVGIDKTIEKLKAGKDRVQSFMGYGQVDIKGQTVKQSGEFQILQFSCRYKIGDLKIDSIEKYYFSPIQNFHAVLRWSDKSDAGQVTLAKKDFETLTVQFKNGNSR